MSKSKFVAAVVTLAALSLTGCTIQVTTEVEADGSGLWRTEIGLTESDIENMRAFGGEFSDDGEFSEEEICQQLASEQEGVSLSQERRDDQIWCVAEESFEDLEELRALYEESDLSVNDLRIEDGTFYYEVALDIEDETAFDFIPQTSWQLRAPGPVEESNADEVDGRTLTWELQAGEGRHMTARTGVGGISTTLKWAALGVGVLLVCLLTLAIAGGGVWWWTKKRSAAR